MHQKIAFVYVAVPVLALFALVLGLALLRVNGFLGGITLAIGLGVGVGYYYDHITDPE